MSFTEKRYSRRCTNKKAQAQIYLEVLKNHLIWLRFRQNMQNFKINKKLSFYFPDQFPEGWFYLFNSSCFPEYMQPLRSWRCRNWALSADPRQLGNRFTSCSPFSCSKKEAVAASRWVRANNKRRWQWGGPSNGSSGSQWWPLCLWAKELSWRLNNLFW